MSENIENPRWRLDKRVPLAVLITILIQMVGVVVWATHLDARVDFIEEKTAGVSALSERLGRIEERIDGIKQDTQSVKHNLEVLTGYFLK
jgi:Tfp pilus assembly protein PilO